MKKRILGMFVAAVATLSLFAVHSSFAASSRDCDANAIIYCGALTQNELKTKYSQNTPGDLDNIFSHYGISSGAINNETMVMGKVYKDGRVTVGNETVATSAQSVGRQNITGSTAVNIDGKTYYQRPTSVSFNSNSLDALIIMRNGQFYRAIITSCGNPVIATPKPKPTYTCDKLTATKVSRNVYSFTSKASAANGAEIVSYNYDFGDGTKENGKGATIPHTYQNPGTYTIKMTVNVKVDGKTIVVSGPKCKARIVVEPAPAYRCVSLTYTAISQTEFRFTTTATATNGASIVGYDYTYGDGTSDKGKGAVVNHKYTAPGTYTVSVTVNVRVGNETKKVTDSNCKVQVTIPKPDEVLVCNPATGEIITVKKEDAHKYKPVGDEACQRISVCELATKKVITIRVPEYDETKHSKDLSKCVETPQVLPAQIAPTGPAELIAAASGLSSLTAASYYWTQSRRALRDSIFSKQR